MMRPSIMCNMHKRIRFFNSDGPLIPMVRLILIENDVILMVLLGRNNFACKPSLKRAIIGHVRVHLSLHFKARLSAKSRFFFILKLELITMTQISHLDSL